MSADAPGLPLTRLSLFYLCAYLTATGLALMTAPAPTLRWLQASGRYDDAMPRFAGVLMLALGLLVSQVIWRRLASLYPATIAIRLVIWTYVCWLFVRTGDRFFATVLGVLGLGILLTAAALTVERRRPAG
ncbi:MAG: hypothetical protein U0P30_05205 [Vicinamibacterales bacterium]